MRRSMAASAFRAELPFAAVKRAKLILTDDLIAAMQQEEEAGSAVSLEQEIHA